MYFAIRIRGQAAIQPDTRKTLELLGMDRKHVAIVIPQSQSSLGMLRKAKDYITFGTGSKEVLAKLLEKRGRMKADAHIDAAALKAMKVASFTELADKIFSGAKLRDFGIKSFFRLHPPKGGFKGTIKKAVKSKGELGDRGEQISALFERMI